jgi:hypothetical protein
MANPSYGGFRVWGTFTGGEGVIPSPFVQEVANNYNTALGIGDIIIPVSDGTVARAAASNNGLLLGVIVGVSYVASGIGQGRRYLTNYLPASTTFTPTTVGSQNASLIAYVPLTPDVILEADTSTTTTDAATAIGHIGENVDLATGTADTITGVSAFCLDGTTFNTTTANFRVIGIRGYSLNAGFSTLANDPTTTRFKYLVTCNEGFLPPYTTSGV